MYATTKKGVRDMVSNRTAQEWTDAFVLEDEAARMLRIPKRTIMIYKRGERKGRSAPQAYRCGRWGRYKAADVIASAEARCSDDRDKKGE